MNIAEHKLDLFRQIDELSEESLIELEKIIEKLKFNQNAKINLMSQNNITAAFGLLKAKKGVSLTQMDEAIAKAACDDLDEAFPEIDDLVPIERNIF